MGFASLQRAIQDHLGSWKELRPIFTSLNGDNSWLMSFPRPGEERRREAKAYYHVVFEPWLAGPASLLSDWFLSVSLSAAPAISNKQHIETIICLIEVTVSSCVEDFFPHFAAKSEGMKEVEYNGGIDAILLGFHYLDHTHEATLRLFNKAIPVIATPEAAKLVQRWNHFTTIRVIQDLPPQAKSWRSPDLHPGDPLPFWLSLFRLSAGQAELNFCLVIVWTHTSQDQNGEEIHEAILSSPHGTQLDGGPLQAFLDASPPTQKLAMLHGLKESRAAGRQNTLGVKGGLALYRRVGGVKYWILSHHSELKYSGLLMRLLRTKDTQRTLDWGLEEEVKSVPAEDRAGLVRPNVVEVGNGRSFILDSWNDSLPEWWYSHPSNMTHTSNE